MSRYRNLLLFLILAVVWGSAFTAIKAGLEYFPPVWFAAVRYDIAGVIMLGYAWLVTDRWRPRSNPEWAVVGIGALFMIAGYHSFLFVGEQGTTSAAAAVIVSLSPVLTAGFARGLLPSERLSVTGLIGLGLGFAGVVILADPTLVNLFSGDTLPELLVFSAAASFALGSVLARRFDADLPIETMEAWSMIGGAIIMHGVSVGLREPVLDVQWTPTGTAALLYLALAASAGGFLIYFDLLDRLGPIEINLVSYAAPVAAAITGFLLLNETPSVATAIGFVLILIGFGLIKAGAFREFITRVRPVGG